MKLRRHAKPDHEAASGAADTDAGTEPTTTLALRLLISSNTGLPEQDFNAQKDMISRVAAFDPATRFWHAGNLLDRPEWAAEVLNTLSEAGGVHGTLIKATTHPAHEASPAPGTTP